MNTAWLTSSCRKFYMFWTFLHIYFKIPKTASNKFLPEKLRVSYLVKNIPVVHGYWSTKARYRHLQKDIWRHSLLIPAYFKQLLLLLLLLLLLVIVVFDVPYACTAALDKLDLHFFCQRRHYLGALSFLRSTVVLNLAFLFWKMLAFAFLSAVLGNSHVSMLVLPINTVLLLGAPILPT
jgi:hypothetical protein